MIRATLGLTLVLLTGVAAVWWTARNLDPMRVLEGIAPARVRTVDLTGSGPFPREQRAPALAVTLPSSSPTPSSGAMIVGDRDETAREPEPGPEPGPGAVAGRGSASPSASGHSVRPSVTGISASPPPSAGGSAAGVAARIAPPGSPDLNPAAPSAPPPLHPEESAALIRRMLALYERAGEGE